MTTLPAWRCRTDGTTFLPPRTSCPVCGDSDGEHLEIAGTGRVRVWTTIHIAPTRYEDDAPYTVILVDLDEGPKIVGRLVGSSGDPRGARVQLRRVDPNRGPMFEVAETP